MSDFTVSIGDLKDKVGSLRQMNSQLKRQVEDLTATEQRMNGMWEGSARDTFHQAFESDRGQMNNFYETVQQYAQKLEEIAANYQKAEEVSISIANDRSYK